MGIKGDFATAAPLLVAGAGMSVLMYGISGGRAIEMGVIFAMALFMGFLAIVAMRALAPQGGSPLSSISPPQAAGRRAEWLACLALEGLPSDYFVLPNNLIPSPSSTLGSVEADVVVVGPSGVFVIEVKSHEGSVTIQHGAAQWRVESPAASVLMRNPVKQVASQIRAMKQYLHFLDVQAPVYGVIFMPNADVAGALHKDVPIYKRAEFLNAFILAKPRVVSDPGRLANCLFRDSLTVPAR